MIDKEIIEMIEDTHREYNKYCDERRCLRDECALLRNEEDIDCQILFTLYKFGVDQKELINKVDEGYVDYCNGRNKSCSGCKMRKFKHENFDYNNSPCCRICYVVLYMNDMLGLIGERKLYLVF